MFCLLSPDDGEVTKENPLLLENKRQKQQQLATLTRRNVLLLVCLSPLFLCSPKWDYAEVKELPRIYKHIIPLRDLWMDDHHLSCPRETSTATIFECHFFGHLNSFAQQRKPWQVLHNSPELFKSPLLSNTFVRQVSGTGHTNKKIATDSNSPVIIEALSTTFFR